MDRYRAPMPTELPPHLAASRDEKGYSLLFRKGVRQWFIHLWSNQVTSCAFGKAPPLVFNAKWTYKFELPNSAKLENKGFYAHDVPSAEQRRRAVAEYAAQVLAHIEDGYELVADSRPLETEHKAKSKPRALPTAKAAKLAPWPALKHWGTRYAASDDPRVQAIATECEDNSEPEVQFAALRSLAASRETVTITGDVSDKAFDGPFLWITGNLHVKGHLELDVDLFVSGNLMVDGIVRDKREWHHLLVGGDVRAELIDMGSQLYAGGKVHAELVLIDGTGEMVAGKGLHTRVLVEEGYDHRITGDLHVRYHAIFANAADEGVATLEKVIAPKIAAAIRRELKAKGEDFYFDKNLVTGAWKKGRDRVFK
jgi:hypothetical protein